MILRKHLVSLKGPFCGSDLAFALDFIAVFKTHTMVGLVAMRTAWLNANAMLKYALIGGMANLNSHQAITLLTFQPDMFFRWKEEFRLQ